MGSEMRINWLECLRAGHLGRKGTKQLHMTDNCSRVFVAYFVDIKARVRIRPPLDGG